MTEVQLDVEANYPILDKVDIPMRVTITYQSKDQIWDCECVLKPVKGKIVTICIQYTKEIIEAIKDHYARTRKNT